MHFFSSTRVVDGIPCASSRPDSVDILKDKEATDHFSRYFQLLRKHGIPKFRIAQSLSVSYDSDKPEEQLWAIHDETIQKMDTLMEENTEKDLLSYVNKNSRSKQNLLTLKRDIAYKMLESCRLCERRCTVDRTHKERGYCSLGESPQLSSVFIHTGEEPELVPSLTIFFAHCNFQCVFCQNYDISQTGNGQPMKAKEIANGINTKWKNTKIRNVNWVGGEPTPHLHYILDVLTHGNTNVPQVWNSNLYNSMESLKLLYGVTDLWLPDFKYGNNACAQRLSKVPQYFDVVTRNLKWLSQRGEEILIRHLVLPNHISCCSNSILEYIANHLNIEKTRINVMQQYHPQWKAYNYEDISRRVKKSEWQEIISYARKLNLNLSL